MTRSLRAVAIAVLGLLPVAMNGQQSKIYWGDEVPAGWTGAWDADLRTYAERTKFTRTMTSLDLLEYVVTLKTKSPNVHVVNMFTSPRGKVAPALVLSNPRVTSAQAARTAGKPVVFLFGNIHPPEPEAAEALLLVARDLLLGQHKRWLDNLVVIIAPIFNIDGTDQVVAQDGSLGSETPYILGVRENSAGLDLNRDSVKLNTVEAQGLYRVLNEWDPVLLLDGHLMSRVSHGYANTYGTTTVPAAAPGPRDYTHDTLFPAVRDLVRKDYGLEVFTHALPARGPYPPTVWSHDAAAWTVEAKFIINDYGLRNRLAIITETPGQPTFERRVYAQYAYIMALLDYANTHGKEMQAVVKKADDDTVAAVMAGAESGQLRNWLDGEYKSRGKIDLLAYPTNVAEYRAGTSLMSTRPGTASGPPEVIHNVDDLTKPVGTRDATVPRAYILPASLVDVVAKLRMHNIRFRPLDKPMRVEGDAFTIQSVRKARNSGYEYTVLDGTFASKTTEFPAGSIYVDMAQPMANAAFYYLEPQARDGFVGWGVMDDVLQKIGAGKAPVEYPIFKVRKPL